MGRIEHVIFFKGLLETMDYFVDKLEEGAKELGIDTYVINTNDPSTYQSEEFVRFFEQDKVAAFLLNQIGLGMKLGEENLWEKYHIPVYDFIQDHPRNFFDSLVDPISDFHAIVIDHDHEPFIRRYFPKIGPIHFLPNGGAPEGKPLPYKERPIDVLYCGSCQEPLTSFPAIPFLKNSGQDFYQTAIGTMIANPMLTMEQVVRWYLTEQEKCSEEQIFQIIMAVSLYIDKTVRRYFKLQGMHLLDEAGIKVEVYGEKWTEGGETFSDNIRFHGRVSSKKCNELAGQARIALNYMPWYKHGASERVFNSMIGGALCISDRCPYLEDRYEDGKEMLFFDLSDQSRMVSMISDMLSDPQRAEEIAAAGAKKALAEDTWTCRMKEIMRIMNYE
ncbi:MAG: glycosyltransferase [Lachnospiraceae bacterium]|nr:glycosyltransferase [Lachnospiraceae bacterium]